MSQVLSDEERKAIYETACNTTGAGWRSISAAVETAVLAKLADRLKDAPQRAPDQLEAAARKMAELFDYPWDYMPEQGRQTMRSNVIAILQAINAQKGPQ